MPKLLDFVKENDMSHEEVMELITDYKTFQEAGKPDHSSTSESKLKGESRENDKPDSNEKTLEEEIDEMLDEEEEETEKKIQPGMTKEEIQKLVNSEIRSNLKKIVKVVRKAPPQPEEREEKTMFNAVKRSPYEQIR